MAAQLPSILSSFQQTNDSIGLMNNIDAIPAHEKLTVFLPAFLGSLDLVQRSIDVLPRYFFRQKILQLEIDPLMIIQWMDKIKQSMLDIEQQQNITTNSNIFMNNNNNQSQQAINNSPAGPAQPYLFNQHMSD